MFILGELGSCEIALGARQSAFYQNPGSWFITMEQFSEFCFLPTHMVNQVGVIYCYIVNPPTTLWLRQQQ